LTIQHGIGNDGGGILNAGTLALTDSVVTMNYCGGGGPCGAGITNGGTLTIRGGTLSAKGNAPGDPNSFTAAFYGPCGGTTIFVNSTVTGSTGATAIYSEGCASCSLNNVTVTANSGVGVFGGTGTVGNSILAGNGQDCAGPITSA